MSALGGNAFVVDANGSGASRHFYFYAADLDDPLLQKNTTIFAFTNNTSVRLQYAPDNVIWSGTLNAGEHHTEVGLRNKGPEVVATNDVAVLDHAVSGYYVPSETGLFAGIRFLTYVRWGGSLDSQALQIMGYYNDTGVTVRFSETGALAWSGVLDRGEMATLPNDPREYYEVDSDKPVTLASFDMRGTYNQIEFAADATGTRFGKEFLTPTPVGPASILVLFARLNGTHVEVFNASAGSLVAEYNLEAGEYRALDPTSLSGSFTRIRSSNPITVQVGDTGLGSHTYVPVLSSGLPDLAVRSADIAFDSPGPLPLGRTVTVNVTIRNLGANDAGAFAVRLLDGPVGTGRPIGGEVFSLDWLPTGDTFNASVQWTPTDPGSYDVCLQADPEDYVGETDETNNFACTAVDVSPPPEPRPDYVPVQAWPAARTTVGLLSSVLPSVQVLNRGNASAATSAELAYYNASTPTSPFASFTIPPLAPSELSTPFSAAWTAPGTAGTYRLLANVDYRGDVPELDETNNTYTWTIDVVPGPVTSLVLGQPNVTLTVPYVTSTTPLSFSVADPGGTGTRNTTYRIDGGPWTNYTTTGPFSLAGEGEHLLEWYSVDWAGNVETTRNATVRVDNSPPSSTPSIGDPKYLVGGTFVTSSTPFSLAAADGGVTPVGLNVTEYYIDMGPWTPYTAPFTLVGEGEGPHSVVYRSTDRLGNTEPVRTLRVSLDDTPPTTSISPSAPPFPAETRFDLTVADAGCGVNRTEYRIDGGTWTPFTTPFTVPEGDHMIGYRSVDNLGNAEAERTLNVPREVALPVELNLKPFVALVFAAMLLAAGMWSSRRAPWRGGKRRRAVLNAIAVFSLPLVLLEAATGVVSLLTGLLAIPPPLGVGTAVDVAILGAGLAVAVYRGVKIREPASETSGR